MQNQSARVVLGACLFAASLAAQAPAPSNSSDPSTGAFAAATTAGADSGLAKADATGGTGLLRGKQRFEVPQDSVDYTLRGLFLTHHGDFMRLRERYTPQVEIAGRTIMNGRVMNDPGSFNLLGYDFDANLPALVSTDGYLSVGGYYKARRYMTSRNFGRRGNTGGLSDDTLVSTGIRLGFGTFINDNVHLEAQVAPSVFSDFDGPLKHQDYDFPAHALLTVRTIPNFFFKVGARYNQTFEDAPWLPLLGFSWVIDNFRIDVLAPQSIEMSLWTDDQKFGFLVGGYVSGAEYRVHTDSPFGDQTANARVQECIVYLGMLSRLTENLSFGGKVGCVVAGDYNLTSGSPTYNRVNGQLEPALFGELSMGLSF